MRKVAAWTWIALFAGYLPQPASAQTLTGPWRVVAMSDGPAIPADAEAIFDFDRGRIAGRAFCNRFNATFEREGPEVTIGQAATTRMACPPPLMALEATFFDILGKANGATVDAAGILTLRTPDGRSIRARRT
jgi:heat shock protein HslJ